MFFLRPIVLLAACVLVMWMSVSLRCEAQQEPFPHFIVPGHEQDMQALEAMHALHRDRAFTDCTLWDAWLPHATLWSSEKKQQDYSASFLRRRIDDEGYVAMQQHRGMAHSDGWPFPAWQQSTGIGFHFSNAGDGWAIQNFALKPLESTDGWEVRGASVEGIEPQKGLTLQVTDDTLRVTTPAFHCGTIVAPFARLEWGAQALPDNALAKIQWLLEGESDWDEDCFVVVPIPRSDQAMQFANIPLYRHPGYAGLLTRYRLTVEKATGALIQLKSIITAIDTRHPITNALFVRGCIETFDWTGDTEFLRSNIERMRTAIRYAITEFSVEQQRHVFVPWVGHEGRSGLQIDADGKKAIKPGVGVGNNYWDLLPFGAHDAIATMYLFDAMSRMAQLEKHIAFAPELGIAPPLESQSSKRLGELAESMRTDFQSRFWNASTGRFVGWIDREGRAYDYGFTFVNLEAIDYGLASTEQANSILDWLDGRREVAGDTSRGADIYHWRFGPRSTTLRNIETYVWVWSGPETIPWGNQVQDGGAVLGFSYFDLMARLKTRGPDDAWSRLHDILAWFRDVQYEGGYRAYYSVPGRGTLQGGGPPGGLGLDAEFFESVLVPQIMMYGFLGFEPTADGYRVHPQLPSDWPSLTITGIRIHDRVVDITAYPDGRVVESPTIERP